MSKLYFWTWKKRGKNQREKLHPTPFATIKEVERDLYFNSGILKRDIEFIRQVQNIWVGADEQQEGNSNE